MKNWAWRQDFKRCPHFSPQKKGAGESWHLLGLVLCAWPQGDVHVTSPWKRNISHSWSEEDWNKPVNPLRNKLKSKLKACPSHPLPIRLDCTPQKLLPKCGAPGPVHRAGEEVGSCSLRRELGPSYQSDSKPRSANSTSKTVGMP